MDHNVQNIINNTKNVASMEPVSNMQQLVSHWSTISPARGIGKRKRGYESIRSDLVSGSLDVNIRPKHGNTTKP